VATTALVPHTLRNKGFSPTHTISNPCPKGFPRCELTRKGFSGKPLRFFKKTFTGRGLLYMCFQRTFISKNAVLSYDAF
jgi:hypothetical protein